MREVIVTTEYRGVFFGSLESEDADRRIVSLTNARNVIYWDAQVRGFAGLAVNGALGKTQLGVVVPTLRLWGVTSVIDCTADAAESLRK